MSFSAISKNAHGIAETEAKYEVYATAPKTYRMHDFSGGLSSAHIAALCNLIPEKSALVSAPTPSAVSMAVCPGTGEHVPPAEGEVLGECEADGIWLFRKGRSLYARQDGIFYALGEEIFSSAASTIYYIGGIFCIMDGTRVFFCDRTLTITEAEVRIPVGFYGISADGEAFTVGEAPNALTPYMELRFDSLSTGSLVLPAGIACDPTDIHVWKCNGNGERLYEYSDTAYTFDGETVSFRMNYAGPFAVQIKLAPTGGAEELSFASTAHLRACFVTAPRVERISLSDGRTLFFPCPGKNTGEVPCRVLALPAMSAEDFVYISEDTVTTTPYAEPIMAYAGYAKGVLVFSDHFIKMMNVSLSEPDEQGEQKILLAVEDFKRDFGCDMPESICAMNNTLFFADSRSGIFCVDRFGIADRDSTVRISAPVEKSFFAHAPEEYAAATAICAFGCYYLTVGQATYRLDLSAGLPTNAAKGVWTMLDAVLASRFLRYQSDGIFYTDRDTKALMCLSPRAPAAGANYVLKTAEGDLGEPGEKTILEFSLCAAGGHAWVRFFYDGVEAPEEYRVDLTPTLRTVSWKLPRRRAQMCAVEIFAESPVKIDALGYTFL